MTTDPGQPADTRPAKINRGDVFWIAAADARGPIPAYSHPYVVVQNDVFNHSRITTVIVCALTSNLHRANEPGNVLLDVGEGNLPRQSVIVVSQICWSSSEARDIVVPNGTAESVCVPRRHVASDRDAARAGRTLRPHELAAAAVTTIRRKICGTPSWRLVESGGTGAISCRRRCQDSARTSLTCSQPLHIT
jgi:mRNA interferase MazF